MKLMCKKDLKNDKDYTLYKSGKTYDYYILSHNEQVFMVYDNFRVACPFYITHEISSILQLKHVFYTIEEFREMQLEKLLN